MNSTRLFKVYMLRCRDGSLYTGQTNCFAKRYGQHLEKFKGAKYTRRGIEDLVYLSFHPDLSSALREENRLKKLTKQEKEQLVGCFCADGQGLGILPEKGG